MSIRGKEAKKIDRWCIIRKWKRKGREISKSCLLVCLNRWYLLGMEKRSFFVSFHFLPLILPCLHVKQATKTHPCNSNKWNVYSFGYQDKLSSSSFGCQYKLSSFVGSELDIVAVSFKRVKNDISYIQDELYICHTLIATFTDASFSCGYSIRWSMLFRMLDACLHMSFNNLLIFTHFRWQV